MTIDDKIQVASERISKAVEIYKPVAVFGLFSGGHDSTTACKVASMSPHFTGVVHINTGTGIKRTLQFVRETAQAQGWPLFEYEAEKNINAKGQSDPQIYRDIVLKHGFPGAFAHRMMYSKLKERCLRMLEREWKCTSRKGKQRQVLLISGARQQESQRRMGNTKEIQVDGKRIWLNAILDWSKLETTLLMEKFGIPRNPVVDLIHKSGECLCGAFAKPGELEELGMWPDTKEAYDRIKALELEVKTKGFPWGWEQQPPKNWNQKVSGPSAEQQMLCYSCNKREEQPI